MGFCESRSSLPLWELRETRYDCLLVSSKSRRARGSSHCIFWSTHFKKLDVYFSRFNFDSLYEGSSMLLVNQVLKSAVSLVHIIVFFIGACGTVLVTGLGNGSTIQFMEAVPRTMARVWTAETSNNSIKLFN